MSAKHTAGPWIVENENYDQDGGTLVRTADTTCICNVWGTERAYDPNEESVANARLIAAAPDLLSVLEELVDGMPDVEDSKTRVLARARDTIAAARGLSSATSTVSEG